MIVDTDKFWRDGYLVFRGAIDCSKVARWREAGLRAKAKQDLLSDDVLAEVVCDGVLVETARKILGGDPVYFGDSTVQRGTGAGTGFHKDNSDRLDGKAPDWQVDRYPIIRFGIYTQAHGRLPFGLDVREGSHNIANYTSGKMVNIDVEPGDLVVWNGRTTHSGNSKIFKLIHRRIEPNPASVPFRIMNRLGGLPWLFLGHPQERVAIFTSYALASPSLDRHIEYLRQREYAIELWRSSNWSDDARKRAIEAGLSLLDVTTYTHDGRKLYKYYNAISY